VLQDEDCRLSFDRGSRDLAPSAGHRPP